MTCNLDTTQQNDAEVGLLVHSIMHLYPSRCRPQRTAEMMILSTITDTELNKPTFVRIVIRAQQACHGHLLKSVEQRHRLRPTSYMLVHAPEERRSIKPQRGFTMTYDPSDDIKESLAYETYRYAEQCAAFRGTKLIAVLCFILLRVKHAQVEFS